uniref:Uncharacterized protein n=1 Tax=Physcomitrium patens TaxID=3218 RepID=A0A2K1JYR3_PHYPA|nr:hypothetical protein PHYPA_013780 [Physcomitrium patens]
MSLVPKLRKSADTAPKQEQQLIQIHIIGNVCNTISNTLESKYNLLSNSRLNNISAKMFSNDHINIYNFSRHEFVSRDFFENNNSFEKKQNK